MPLSQSASVNWLDRDYCQRYSEMWNISTDEIHYGWLAPGESSVGVLSDELRPGVNVLDLGCGMGENLIAASKKDLRCFGLDISPHMLTLANDKQRQHLGTTDVITFACEDMRGFTAFQGVMFDVVLSIYSFEYVGTVVDLRGMFSLLHQRIRPGGCLVICLSHPLQYCGHRQLSNASSAASTSSDSPYIYSFRDIIVSADEAGFAIERIVEQKTENPSTISDQDAARFPYRFFPGKNPCRPDFDGISNAAPHSAIYKLRRPLGPTPASSQPGLSLKYGKVRLWGRDRTVTNRDVIRIPQGDFEILTFAKSDSLVGMCLVMDFVVEESDVPAVPEDLACISPNGMSTWRHVSGDSMLAVVTRRLITHSINPVLQVAEVKGPDLRSHVRYTFVASTQYLVR